MSSAAGATYNPLLPAVRRNPYPTYRALRRADPVHRSLLMDTWVIARYDDVSRLLRDQHLSAERERWKGFQAFDGRLDRLTDQAARNVLVRFHEPAEQRPPRLRGLPFGPGTQRVPVLAPTQPSAQEGVLLHGADSLG